VTRGRGDGPSIAGEGAGGAIQPWLSVAKPKIPPGGYADQGATALDRRLHHPDHARRYLKKLVESSLLEHQRSRIDRRSVRIKLTAKGREVCEVVEGLCQKHARTLEQAGGINADEFATLNKLLHRLERFWTDQIAYRL
jgi:Winged helix DNA-binding domain